MSNVDPLIGPLQDNGGSTVTDALLDESLAISSELGRVLSRREILKA